MREDQFDGRANRDPWDHLSRFLETCQIQKVPRLYHRRSEEATLVCFFTNWTHKGLIALVA
ncbi:hypothetical protein A2U01_0008551 [Trifolium medium]|uniref:Uncharacterized protein n=1 Tax=Trifolium medium TaxID=97028 RepID=A0A392MN11_9FABA|nr:hypothetical protein [Trifolium medium]